MNEILNLKISQRSNVESLKNEGLINHESRK